MDLAVVLPNLLLAALLLPLVSFTFIFLFGRSFLAGKPAGYVAVGAIVGSFLFSSAGAIGWIAKHGLVAESHHAAGHDDADHGDAEHGDAGSVDAEHEEAEHDDAADAAAALGGAPATFASLRQTEADHAEADHAEEGHADEDHGAAAHDERLTGKKPYYAGNWYTLGKFGSLEVSIGYYIDALTVLMFCMVTFIASCVHIYALGYMHDELHEFHEHAVQLADGSDLHRPGRFHRFFQSLSLFSFSMLGVVVAGNAAMVFVFWELVGICSYFLIGFYFEKQSASNAANKAFIVNRVGDFGMIIGLMVIFSTLGTFNFGDIDGQPGIFTQLRSPDNDYALVVPDSMVRAAASDEIAAMVAEAGSLEAAEPRIAANIDQWREDGLGYGLLVLAGLGIFCGCVGKSAQFPLHVWLPDAMEGPTPVSALVHSATMVAAGVYLVGRFFPAMAPEALLVVASVGAITLFMAATIAITATDIKRVLAYSTVSQLGYMMLALGVGGWGAGLFHLITHAFFKSLLFMCSGSVIHACHTNEMTEMGGLRKKMPWTAYTMLFGCLPIIGAGLPLVFFGDFKGIGLSGFYSKDGILEQALLFKESNPTSWLYGLLFYAPAIGAVITALYMFRMWYMTFCGEPRNHHVYEHAHESPPVMYVPLVVLAVLAAVIGWSFDGVGVSGFLLQADPEGATVSTTSATWVDAVIPSEHDSHEVTNRFWAAVWAFSTGLTGLALATAIYLYGVVNPELLKKAFYPVWAFLRGKWYFDELYHYVFIVPTHALSYVAAQFDKIVIDGVINVAAAFTRAFSFLFDAVVDRIGVDGSINLFADATYRVGLALRGIQLGALRYYVVFIALFTVALFLIASSFRVFAG